MTHNPVLAALITGSTLILTAGCATQDPSSTKVADIRFTQLNVFDGTSFVKRDLCIRQNLIVDCASGAVDTVDMGNAFVTPPFGDAHTHHFDGSFTLDWHIGLAIQSGAFYFMTMTAPTEYVGEIRGKLNGPGRIDVASATGGITGPESHPAEIYEALALGHRSYEAQLKFQEEIRASQRMADNAYYVLEDETDIVEKWPLIQNGSPDLIKVFLRHSHRYDEGFGKWGPGGGMNPNLLSAVRKKSKENGLRLAVAASHIEDYRASVRVGADILTHLPCYQDTEVEPNSPYYNEDFAEDCLLSDDDANDAAEINMVNTLIVTEWVKPRKSKYVEWEQANVNRLIGAKAPLAFGSNQYGSTMTAGLIAGAEKRFLPANEILKIATMDSPKAIFPERKVGCLDYGCEASFIAFAENPIEDFRAIETITYRLKGGIVLNPKP